MDDNKKNVCIVNCSEKNYREIVEYQQEKEEVEGKSFYLINQRDVWLNDFDNWSLDV